MGASTRQFIETLTREYRVIVIGGLAVIAHGFNRPTKDADVWLEPLDSPADWAEVLKRACSKFDGLSIHTLPGWKQVTGEEIAIAAEEVGMVRVLGLECPLDIFRTPNEFPADSFDEVYLRGTGNADGTRLPDPLDLIVTKLDTGRTQDFHDAQYLESVVRERYRRILPSATIGEVRSLFARFLDWQGCESALENPSQEVRDYAIVCLREMADEGDPFSQALLQNRNIPYSPDSLHP